MTTQQRREAINAILIGFGCIQRVQEWCRLLNPDDRRECVGALLQSGANQEIVRWWQDLCDETDETFQEN